MTIDAPLPDIVLRRRQLLLRGPAMLLAAPRIARAAEPAPRDGGRDFDFEFGAWRTRLKRLRNPLTGSTTWIDYEGTTVVRPVWKGRANLLELFVDGPAGRIEALSLRLYDPDTAQWTLNFSNSASGTLATPMTGRFANGRGEFRSEETFNGQAIAVRFLIVPDSPSRCRFEQAFSIDHGVTWETNWIAIDTRLPH